MGYHTPRAVMRNSDVRQRVLEELRRLPENLQRHIEAVRLTSVELARAHGLDIERAELAAQAHDICRLTKASDLIAQARRLGLPVTPLDEAVPVFLHGPVGAEVLRHDYGLRDDAVLDPVRYHTMGRAGMSALEKVVFLADKLEPSKVSRYPFIAEVARLANDNLDRGVLSFIDHQVKAFIDHGDLVHPGMAEARNDAVLALKRRQRDAAPGS